MATILITDDSRFMRSRVRQVLEALGHQVREATDGREAVAAAAAEPPDLLFIDLSMPNMDGRAVLQTLRDRHVDFPVIVLTADVQETIVSECLALGAADVLHKPPKDEKIAAALARVLGTATRTVA